MKTINDKRWWVAFFLFLLPVTSVAASDVVQGKCIQSDIERQWLRLEEYDINLSPSKPYGNPTGIIFEGDFKGAKMSVPPESGDILRLLYRQERGGNRIMKIMNLTRQEF